MLFVLTAFGLLWGYKYIQCTDLASHASLHVVLGLLACLVWFLCSRARINVPARVPADWSPSSPFVVPLPVVVPLLRVGMLLVLSNRGWRSVVVPMLFIVISEPLYPYSCCNRELVCSMLSSAVFQKTSPWSLGWNTGRSGFLWAGVPQKSSRSFVSFLELLFLHKNNSMVVLLKTSSVRG